MRKILIRLNNVWARRRLAGIAPGNLLVLAPHCLQRSDCERNILPDPDHCARCGQCDVAGLLRLRDALGVPFRIVAGGRLAVAEVKKPDVHGVIAVACGKELSAGILASFPKPVFAIFNHCPHGPCRDTRVSLDEVETALKQVFRS